MFQYEKPNSCERLNCRIDPSTKNISRRWGGRVFCWLRARAGEIIFVEPKWLRKAPSDRVVGGCFCVWGAWWAVRGDKEASQTRDYCAAKSAARRAARSGPSATIKPSLRDDNSV
jgi:hypothetical protein